MNVVKSLLTFVVSGALAGVFVASLIAPGLITWYNTPGSMQQALCNCIDLVRDTASNLLRAQLYGAIIGAIIFLVIGVIVVQRRARRLKPSATPS